MKWYKDDELWKAFYDCMFDEASFALAEQQCPQLLSLVNHDVDHVLDLACGPGRHSLALAKMGYDVTGVDISPFLLQKAKDQASELFLDARFSQADMMEYESANSYDLIINMFNSFGYLQSHEQNQQVLNQCFKNLKQQGTLIIDSIGREALARNMQPVHLSEYEDGSLRIERPLLTEDLQLFSNEWLLIKGDKVFRREYEHYVYTPLELKMMCERAGFENIEVYGSLNAEEYDLDSDQLVIVAEKN